MLFFQSCYSSPEIEGFDKEKWSNSPITCENNRLGHVELLIAHVETLLGASQNEIGLLLGTPSGHELSTRNQKYFYYDLSPQGCDNLHAKTLSIRFDALGRANEVMVIEN